MTYQAPNYFRQGDQAFVFGGKLVLPDGTEIDAPTFMLYDVVDLIAATGTGAGAVLAWQNPTGKAIMVHEPIIDLTTEATGAATVDIGVAADGTTTSDTLFDGLDVGAASGIFVAPAGAGANDAGTRRMTASQYITGTASATLAGLVGKIIIPYYILG